MDSGFLRSGDQDGFYWSRMSTSKAWSTYGVFGAYNLRFFGADSGMYTSSGPDNRWQAVSLRCYKKEQFNGYVGGEKVLAITWTFWAKWAL